MTPVPSPSATESIEQHVQRLLARWRKETAFESSSTRLTENQAYQELIELGSAALPFLFHDLEITGDGHLSKALAVITGAHPIPSEQRGQVSKIAETWLCWARENGYRW